ncbi:hypothetical protein NDU88_005417 [Pleurodeles waltl]|uniref:Uncharacterized protein n=1 Tax=Pleurodeles waltl TaxID=8319 RepID=A0AAV7TAE9_PLEWA|nr:hypothetical protein NDU88_005417 [Pleurodeles waltl]
MPRKSQRLLGLGEVSSDEGSRPNCTEETTLATRRTQKRRTCGSGTMDSEDSYTPRICRDTLPAQCNMRAIAAPPSGGNPRNYWGKNKIWASLITH